MPDVSVIVPARNAAFTLPATLAAVAAQRFGGTVEHILVDDGSADATAALAESAGWRVLRNERPLGAAGARNAGAALATASVLAFTDADCEPVKSWLAAGLGVLGSADLVQGAVSPTPGVAVGPFDRTLWVTSESGLYESANLFMKRDTFDRVGGFRPFLEGAKGEDGSPLRGLLPRLGEGPFGEDVWLGWRARRAGARVAFCEEALVHHAVFPRDIRGALAERSRLRHFPALVLAVPELRSRFFLGVFLTRRTASFDLAAASTLVALARRRPAALAGALPYLLEAAPERGRRNRGGAAEALQRVPLDAAGLVALLRGSAAAGTAVL